MSKFVYSVLRYVPDLASGEFVNLGAIVGSEASQEWSYRIVGTLARANALARAYESDASLALSHAARLFRPVDEYNFSFQGGFRAPPLSEEWLRKESQRLEHSLQLSEPSVVVADDAAAALDVVFDTMIPYAEPRHRAKDRRAATRAARDAYARAGLADLVVQDVEVKSAHHPAEFDLAIANGTLVQLVKSVSFQIQSVDDVERDVKAWAWSLRDVRHNGGSLQTKQKQYHVSRDVDVAVVYMPASNDRGSRKAFDQAQAIFQDPTLKVQAFSADEAEQLAAKAKGLIRVHV